MPRYEPILEPRTHVVRIEKLGIYGEGVVHLSDHEVLFVPHTAMGEMCEVVEVSRYRHYVMCRKLRTHERGQDQIDPKCALFGTCGGCQLQHIDYDAQVAYKRDMLRHVIHKNLALEIEPEAFACPTPYGYRRRVRMRQHAGQVGYYQSSSLKFVPVRHCPIAHDAINHWLSDDSHFPRPDTKHDISLDVEDDGQVMTYVGSEQARMGFRQANAWGEETLQSLVSDVICNHAKLGVLELYAGTGTLVLAKGAFPEHLRYVGVDGDSVNIERAQQMYGRPNIGFEMGSLPVWFLKQQIRDAEFFRAFDMVVLDPPRNGVGRDIKRMTALSEMRHIIYVSCDPLSWSWEVKCLIEPLGFHLARVAMIDMFPQTRHFEIFSHLVS